MSSTPLNALHWDVIDQLQRDGGWVFSRTLYMRLRPTYGYSAAAAKTMQRALQHLHQTGIIDSRGKGSGRSWLSIPDRVPTRAKVDSVELAVALLQLERFAENQLPADALKTLREHCDLSRDLLDSHPSYPRYLQGRAWRGKAAVIDSGYPLLPPELDEAIMDAVTDSLYRNKMLLLDYQNAALATNVPVSYHVSALALIERGSVLYLVSCRRSRRSGRFVRYLHRLDRIVSATVTDEPADMDADFDLERFLRHEHTLLFFPEAPQQITLRVQEHGFRSRLRHYRLSEDQTIRETRNGFELVATVRPSLTFKQFLLGLAPDVILIKPPHLRKELQGVLEAGASAYSTGKFSQAY
ncbi:helix-turn-helix transcriptional regulator [Achromobacter dolens]|jgi:predicted DNA-binding transcriptional regulator YafY|uniref:helix-turn-helix transcriptional regulator n=1 Tax=Achromobacter dolens TaxID=1287738 RepID=UPI0035582EDF